MSVHRFVATNKNHGSCAGSRSREAEVQFRTACGVLFPDQWLAVCEG